jgi:arginase
VSRLRARCPDCRTLTAVAVGPEYQCHSCGREFSAGLVRVPRAWGEGGDAMAEAAFHELPYPEAAVIEADTLAEQTLLLASELPDRPVVLGGCCCTHVGAIEALSSGEERLAVVWVDAHGDLNTPETSPSGNAWGMPLRMVLDDGAVLPQDVALLGARNLDPPEVEFIAAAGIHTGDDAIQRALEGADAVYVALDADSLEPGELAVFMPEPDGLRLTEVENLLAEIASRKRIAGLGFTCLVHDEANEPKLARLASALGL